MSNARDKANIPALNFSSTGIDDNATSTAITINSSEYVGINTTSPQRYLHITGNDGASGTNAGNSDTQLFIDNDGSNGAIIEFGASNTGAGSILFSDEDASNRGKVQYFHSSNNMVFSTNGSEAMRIDSSGNVGIGESSPGAKLEVKDNTNASDTLRLSSQLQTTGNYHDFVLGINDFYGVGLRRTLTQSSPSAINPRLDLFVQNTNTYQRPDRGVKMSILGNGRVGIGTTAPSSTLHVNGNFTSTGIDDNATSTAITIDSSERVGIGTTSPSSELEVYGASTPKITVKSGNGTSASIKLQRVNENDASTDFELKNDAGELKIIADNSSQNEFETIRLGSTEHKYFTNNTERMRINSDGAVSIGSSNVTQNSHFNVRQDVNTHATRTYLQARVGSGALYSIKYLGTIPAVSLGTQLIIPFISQNNINSKTYVHIRGMSCESNTNNPKAFDVKFSVGHINTLATPTVLQNLGTCTGVSKSGMNVILSFNTDYTHTGDSGMFIEIDYIAHHQDASIDLTGIVMN